MSDDDRHGPVNHYRPGADPNPNVNPSRNSDADISSNWDSQPAFEIVRLPPPETPSYSLSFSQCYDIRVQVFVREQGFSLDLELDELDISATHFLLRLVPSLEPIGTIRVSKHTSKPIPDSNPTSVQYQNDSQNIGHSSRPGQAYYRLSRLAILKPFRRHGFGRVLVVALHQWVKEDARAVLGMTLQEGDADDTGRAAELADAPSIAGSGIAERPPKLGVAGKLYEAGAREEPLHGKEGKMEVRMVCHSQLSVKPFYAKFGYEPEDDEFIYDGVRIQKMVARLPLSP